MWTGNNRASWHDYSSRAIYHITLKKSPAASPFGVIGGNCALRPGVPGSPFLRAGALGLAVKRALRELPLIHPALSLYQYALMPDHLHMIISVEAPMDDILGRKLAAFKVRVNHYAGMDGVFDKGFNDQIIGPGRSLDVVYRYLRENPFRLAVRRANPDFFRRLDNLEINGRRCRVYGNLHLLDNPFKEQVVVHRADDDATRRRNRERWLYAAANGGVLVSPFISPAEKAVRAEAEALGGRLILITDTHFGERYKPAAHDFELCLRGRLLIVSPLGDTAPLSRERCLRMNDFASALASDRI